MSYTLISLYDFVDGSKVRFIKVQYIKILKQYDAYTFDI